LVSLLDTDVRHRANATRLALESVKLTAQAIESFQSIGFLLRRHAAFLCLGVDICKQSHCKGIALDLRFRRLIV
jgi:hypothetical protein